MKTCFIRLQVSFTFLWYVLHAMGCLFVFFSFIPPPCRFWRVGDESDDDDSDDLHNFDVVNVCKKREMETICMW